MNRNTKLKLKIIKEYGSISKFAKVVGIPASTIASALAKDIDTMSLDKIRRICKELKIDIETLEPLDSAFDTITSIGGMQLTTSHKVKITVLGSVVAGIPVEAIEDILDYEEIDSSLANTGDFFALKIKGASMEPQFFEGDVVIVRKQSYINSGEIGIMLVNGSDATVKKIKKDRNGILLIGNNTEVYSPHYYTNEEIETLPVRCIGKVVELRRKF
jgi:repressor LexA